MSTLETNSIGKYNGNNVSIDDSLNLKSYTTTQRDALTSAAGDIIYNSTTNKVEHYNGSAWASGTKVVSVEFLIVGGGGGGGKSGQHFLGLGGSGGGGFLASYNNETSGGGTSSLDSLTCLADGSTTYTVTVGAGGTGGTSTGNEGGSSQFILVAFGGSPGAQRYASLREKYGGSGGGGTAINGASVGLPGQGYDGGAGNNSNRKTMPAVADNVSALADNQDQRYLPNDQRYDHAMCLFHNTNLKFLNKSDQVNIEFDYLARFIFNNE